MSLVALSSLSVLVVMASSQTPAIKPHYDVANARPLFEAFVKEHARQYKDEADEKVHFEAFCSNLEKINDLNAKSPSATYGINKFADYTKEESQNMSGFRQKKD